MMILCIVETLKWGKGKHKDCKREMSVATSKGLKIYKKRNVSLLVL